MREWNKKLKRLSALSGFVLGSFCLFSSAMASDEVSELGDLDLGELLTLEVSSATGMAQSLSEAPAIIEVISRKQIQRRNYQSVAEALSSIPGLFVNYDYVFNDVGVRGVSGESRGASRLIKVLIDGHPISFRSETSNWLGPELIPMAAIERIEVIRGPGSALYGANAFLGVISIVTRKAGDIGSTEVHAGGSSFGHWKNGYDFGITSGYEVGPFELLLSLQHQRKNRSGLSLPCTSFLNNVEDPESTFGSSANGCDYQKDKFQKEGVFDRKSFNDIESPTSFVGKLGFELSDVLPLVDEDSNLGKFSFFANLQSIDSRGSFSDWGMLNHSTGTQPDGTEVKMPRTGNRIGLYNSVLAGSYSLELFNERVGLDLGMRYASGGVTDTERLKDISGQLDRSKYGYTGMDYYANLRITALEDVGRVSSLTLIKNLTLVLGADQTVDTPVYIKKEGLSIMDNPTHEYGSAELTNQGALGQITGSLLNGRVSVVVGARYDSNEGAVLEEDRISSLEDEEVERLCNGNQVCYESQNYRAGITFLLLKDFLELEGGPLVDELYSKILWGTAFKAPSPAFLYNSDILGERPFFPNPVLLPQDVSSLEFLLGGSILNSMVQFSVAYYLNTLENKAEFSNPPGKQYIVAKNALTVESQGIEGTLKFSFDPVEVYGTFAQQQSEVQPDTTEELNYETISDTFGFPAQTFSAGVRVAVDALHLSANAEMQYVGERVGYYRHRGNRNDIDNRYTLDAYSLLHMNITTEDWLVFDEKPTRLVLSVRNILDSEYSYPGFQPYYRVDLPGLPRTILFSLEQQL